MSPFTDILVYFCALFNASAILFFSFCNGDSAFDQELLILLATVTQQPNGVSLVSERVTREALLIFIKATNIQQCVLFTVW